MIGAVAGSILISSGVEVQIKDLKSKGKFHPFRGAVVVSYVLAIVGTFIGVQFHGFLASESSGFLWNSVMRYVVPAFAGVIGALLIPFWVSRASKGKRDKRAVEPLIEALKDENCYVRSHAVRDLGKIGDARAVEPLIKALEDEDSDVRETASEALKKIKAKKS
ncbi:MAG: HEAT repeat domain-containing protein [Actinomycetia bacterium]|nr:HEAT repeat domain-containing protein [Actinomycetes bacterium]